MILIQELKAGYTGQPVLSGLNASLDTGKIHGLVGLNGSGKTTLLRVLYGMIKPYSGRALVNEKHPDRKEVAFMESENYFYHNITGSEYLSLFDRSAGFDPVPWLEVFGLPGNKFVDEYSTGMRKKLAFIAVVASGRKVLLLDEPFNGLDMESVRVLSMVLDRMRKNGKTIIITSHILGSLTGLCDTILFLKEGKAGRSFEGSDATEIEKEVFRELDEGLLSKVISLPGI